MKPDAILFAISQYYLSGGAQKRLSSALAEASPIPVSLVRLEGPGEPLGKALDALRDDGHANILVQPLGLPFPESLRAWLPGAVGHWLAMQVPGRLAVRLGGEIADISDVLAVAARSALENADTAEPACISNTALGKPGWQEPPDFKHHLIVCTGPRCAYRDAASLLVALKDETARQKVSGDCLTTRTGCMFPCNQGPMLAVYPRGEWYRLGTSSDVSRFVTAVLVEGRTEPDLLIHTARLARQTA